MKQQSHQRSLWVMIAGFGLLYLIWRSYWLLAPVPLAAVGMLYAPFGKWVHQRWMQLAQLLGYVNSRILLTLLFFLILTPVAALARIFRQNKKQPNIHSNFVTRNHIFTKTDLEHPW